MTCGQFPLPPGCHEMPDGRWCHHFTMLPQFMCDCGVTASKPITNTELDNERADVSDKIQIPVIECLDPNCALPRPHYTNTHPVTERSDRVQPPQDGYKAAWEQMVSICAEYRDLASHASERERRLSHDVLCLENAVTGLLQVFDRDSQDVMRSVDPVNAIAFAKHALSLRKIDQ